MFSRSFTFTLKLCALLVLPVLIAAFVLLSGPAGFGTGEPQSAEAALLSEVKKLLASDASGERTLRRECGVERRHRRRGGIR